MKRIAVLIALMVALQVGKLVVDSILDKIVAPDWAYWASAITVVALWLILGNVILFRRRPRTEKNKEDKPAD